MQDVTLANFNKLLTRWRNEGRELAFLDLEPTEMDEVRNLLSASDGALWASTVGGVYRIDPDTLAVRRFGGEHGLRDVRAYALAEWPRGRIVIGTWAGLFALDMDDGRVVPIDLRLDGRAYEPRLVWDLAPDGGDGLWIGTSNGLLHLANANDPALRRFDTSDGLPNNVVYAIEGHGEDELWLSTNRGLARFDRVRARSVAFDVRDGLQGNEFGFGMAARDAAGHLYFAGLGGVNRFDPAQVHVTPQAPRTLLNHFRLRDRDLVVGAAVDGAIPLPRSLYATDRIELGWRQRDIGFGFSALANDPTEHLLFRYRLVGKDDEWIDAGERRYVGYTNLAPGAYRFEVRAADRFGRDGPVRAVDIDLAPPFWTTWPFLVAASAALLSLFAAILNWRVAALKRSRAMLAAEVARQTERIRLQNEQLEAANHALFERSIRDPLTGAFNRRHFGELAEHAYLGCRARVQPFALLLFDLDHFKQVNDRHGHAAGDAVLCAVAQAVRATLSGQEAMARWGGEEFVAMWPGIDADMAASRATAVRDALRTLRIASDGTTLGITASFGLAVATSTWQPTLEALIAHADAALYRAKADGRDRVVVAAPPT
jgi:diguanylate cyclase (GGDEF)-like protein